MKQFQILKTCLICLFIAACDTQEQTTPIKKAAEIQTAPEKSAPQIAKPTLDLSIDNIAIEHPSNGAIFLNNKIPTEKNSELFETLNKEQAEANIDISGKIYTDEEKLKDKEYLDSVEGVQINVEGKFE